VIEVWSGEHRRVARWTGGLQSIFKLKLSAKIAVVGSWIVAGIGRGMLLLQRDPLICPHSE
jgi:hypothetical protein